MLDWFRCLAVAFAARCCGNLKSIWRDVSTGFHVAIYETVRTYFFSQGKAS